MGLAELASVLWREREMLQLLLFKLDEERLVLAGGHLRWLYYAAHEVDVVLDRLRQTEVLRAVESDAVALALGLPPGARLVVLTETADEPWDGMLRDHRNAFLSVTAEITELAGVIRGLLTAGHRAASLTTQQAQRSDHIDPPAIIAGPALRQAAYQAALAGITQPVQNSLIDYLGCQ